MFYINDPIKDANKNNQRLLNHHFMLNKKRSWVPCYLKSDVDKVISTLKAERDEYRYNLSCARNEIHNISKGMREDIETIARLKA